MNEEDKYLYNVSVDGGKYTFRLDKTGRLDVLRHGEAWWIPDAGSKAIISLMDGEEKRQAALAVVDKFLSAAKVDFNEGVLVKTAELVTTMLREVRGALADE